MVVKALEYLRGLCCVVDKKKKDASEGEGHQDLKETEPEQQQV